MKIWQSKPATGLGTILLGLSASVFVQEQELPNKALLATEINDGRKHKVAQIRNCSWHTVGKNPGDATERFFTR
jgi:hypothetical protein